MTSQDRTSEFFSLCQSLPPPPLNSFTNNNTSSSNNQKGPSSSISTGRYSSTSTAPQPFDPTDELRTFHKTASTLSREIYSTSTLLNELTTLIHSRSGSLFVDETPKVNHLVLQIKSNIEGLNMKLDGANEMIQRNKRRLGKNSQKGMEVSNLVGQLQEEFVNTTKGFKDVLRVRSDMMKDKTDRRNDLLGDGGNEEEVALLGNKPKIYEESSMGMGTGMDMGISSFGNRMKGGGGDQQGGGIGAMGGGGVGGFGSAGPRLDLTSAMLSNTNDASSNMNMPVGESSMQLPRPYGIEASSSGMRNRNTNSSISSIQYNDQTSSSLPVYTPMDIQQMEEQSGQSQMMQLIPDQNYLQERADAMEAVESNIVELGTIFNKLAVMVNEHSEMVTRVEDNVNDANDNIMLSMDTLTDTLDNLRSNKALFFKVFSIMVAFIIFFIVFFA